MGWSIADTEEASLWQFIATVNKYAEAHSPDAARGLDKHEFEELSELIDGNN